MALLYSCVPLLRFYSGFYTQFFLKIFGRRRDLETYNSIVEDYLLDPERGKRYPLAGSHGYFFVPPSVDITEDVLPDARHPSPRNRFTAPVPLLCYPVPPSWYETPKR